MKTDPIFSSLNFHSKFIKKVVILLVLISTGCSQSEKKIYYFQGEALGTTYHIKAIPDDDNLVLMQKHIDSVITAVNNSLSTYQNNSLISHINKGEKLSVDQQFRDVFIAARKIYLETDGYYDPSIGILVNAWGFGPKKKLPNIEKDSSLIDSLKQFVGYNMLQIDNKGTLIKKYPQIYIDYNSIAKGYAIDRIGQMLSDKHFDNYIIEIGGEVLTKGRNTERNRAWLVAVDNPDRKDAEKFISKIDLTDKAMATSGNYRKFYIDKATGRKYVHTLNPKTGYPIQSNLLSASVIADNCTMADGYATAFMVLGFEKSKIFLNNHPELQAFLVFSDEKGNIKTFKTNQVKIEEQKN